MRFFHVQHSQNRFCSRPLAAYALTFPKKYVLMNCRKLSWPFWLLSNFIIGVQESWKFSIIIDVDNERGIQWAFWLVGNPKFPLHSPHSFFHLFTPNHHIKNSLPITINSRRHRWLLCPPLRRPKENSSTNWKLDHSRFAYKR